MKPSQNDRCARAIVRDFLVGLAVFLAVFTLAMLDSRESRSAPALVSMPATIVQNETIIAGNVTTGTLSPQVPGSEDLPVNPPPLHIYSKASGPDDIAEHSSEKSKLAMNTGKSGAGPFATPGMPEASERTWILTVMALIFAAMTALTLGLWRHLRQSVAPRRNGRRV